MSNPHYTLGQQSGEFSSLPDILETGPSGNINSSLAAAAVAAAQQQQQQSPSPQHFNHHSNHNHNHSNHHNQQQQQPQHARSLSHSHSQSNLALPTGSTATANSATTASGPPIDGYQFSAHQDQTTLVLGVMGYIDRLEREITELREFVNLGFKKLNDVGQMDGGIGARIENARLQSRNWNRTNVTELEENFRVLPRSNGEFPTDIPNTGNLVRNVNHKGIDYVLDLYDIPFVPTMFLAEKKMLYLKFIGANRIVMHRILD